MSLSGDGKTLAIGALQLESANQVYVKVYWWDEAALNYKQLGDSITGETAGDRFGTVTVSAGTDGKVLAVGTKQQNVSAGPGYVKVYGVDETALNYRQRIEGEAAKDQLRFLMTERLFPLEVPNMVLEQGILISMGWMKLIQATTSSGKPSLENLMVLVSVIVLIYLPVAIHW